MLLVCLPDAPIGFNFYRVHCFLFMSKFTIFIAHRGDVNHYTVPCLSVITMV